MPVDTITKIDRAASSDTISLRDYIDSLVSTRFYALEKATELVADKMDARFEGVEAAAKLAAGSVEKLFDATRDSLLSTKDAMKDALSSEVRRIDSARDNDIAHISISLGSQEKAAKIFCDKIEAQFMAVAQAQNLAKEAIQLQFSAIQKGTDTATTSLDKRLEGMNEFREQMNDMASKFITRSDVESTIKYMSERISSSEATVSNCISRQEMNTNQTAVSERVSTLEKFSANTQGRMWVIAAVVVIMEIALRFLAH
jgi:hypothetical protein